MVGLNTELGSITVKDVTADEILLTSRSGDIDMDGIIDGDTINAETDGDGDVVITGKGKHKEAFSALVECLYKLHTFISRIFLKIG